MHQPASLLGEPQAQPWRAPPGQPRTLRVRDAQGGCTARPYARTQTLGRSPSRPCPRSAPHARTVGTHARTHPAHARRDATAPPGPGAGGAPHAHDSRRRAHRTGPMTQSEQVRSQGERARQRETQRERKKVPGRGVLGGRRRKKGNGKDRPRAHGERPWFARRGRALSVQPISVWPWQGAAAGTGE